MSKLLEIHFPLGGLNKAPAYQRQKPYTSPSLNNVRPSDTLLGRDRGGSRPGIAKHYAAQMGSGNPTRLLSEVTYATASVAPVTIGLGSSNGTLYKESSGDWASIGGSLTLASDRLLSATPRLMKSYIADISTTPVALGTDGVITGTNTFDSATYADWTAVSGLNINDYVLHLVGVGTYRISAIAAGSLTILDTPANATGLTFRIERAPKIYDPVANTLTLWRATASEGYVPHGHIICLWRDRTVIAGDPLAPHLFYCAKAGDPLVWDYSETDPGAAYTSQGTLAGGIGDTITALIPHGDECMLVGCKKELWVAEGDATYGGGQKRISSAIGVLDKNAYCYTPSGWLFFMSPDGLYAMQPGCGNTPIPVSRNKIPEGLIGIDTSTFSVQMAYDLRDQGMHLFVTPTTGSDAGTQHYFVTTDTEESGGPQAKFFPQSYPFTMEPTAIHVRRDATGANSTVILGCRDGYTRNHVDSQTTDDGTTITSTVMIGPMGFGLSLEGAVEMLEATLATGSGSVTWSLHMGATPEAAVAASAFYSGGGTWAAGKNYKCRTNARGAAFVLKITATTRWALEQIVAQLGAAGEQLL